LSDNEEEFFKYLYYTSAKHIKRLGEPKYKDLRNILNMEDKELRVSAFNEYLRNDIKFPICATTTISAHKLGENKQYFDMVIMD
jgi:hypothetical protein